MRAKAQNFLDLFVALLLLFHFAIWVPYKIVVGTDKSYGLLYSELVLSGGISPSAIDTFGLYLKLHAYGIFPLIGLVGLASIVLFATKSAKWRKLAILALFSQSALLLIAHPLILSVFSDYGLATNPEMERRMLYAASGKALLSAVYSSLITWYILSRGRKFCTDMNFLAGHSKALSIVDAKSARPIEPTTKKRRAISPTRPSFERGLFRLWLVSAAFIFAWASWHTFENRPRGDHHLWAGIEAAERAAGNSLVRRGFCSARRNQLGGKSSESPQERLERFDMNTGGAPVGAVPILNGVEVNFRKSTDSTSHVAFESLCLYPGTSSATVENVRIAYHSTDLIAYSSALFRGAMPWFTTATFVATAWALLLVCAMWVYRGFRQ